MTSRSSEGLAEQVPPTGAFGAVGEAVGQR